MSENDVVKSITDYLELKNYFYWRQNNMPTPKMKGNKVTGYYFRGKKGVPDIIVVKDGQFIGIEAKFGKNKQSKSQKEFQKELEEAGGKYILAYSVDDVIAHL